MNVRSFPVAGLWLAPDLTPLMRLQVAQGGMEKGEHRLCVPVGSVQSPLPWRSQVAQNAGANQGGVNKTQDKSADSKRRQDNETGEGNTEAKPLDPGTGTDGRAPSEVSGGRS
jgi:hypothetical protein